MRGSAPLIFALVIVYFYSALSMGVGKDLGDTQQVREASGGIIHGVMPKEPTCAKTNAPEAVCLGWRIGVWEGMYEIGRRCGKPPPLPSPPIPYRVGSRDGGDIPVYMRWFYFDAFKLTRIIDRLALNFGDSPLPTRTRVGFDVTSRRERCAIS